MPTFPFGMLCWSFLFLHILCWPVDPVGAVLTELPTSVIGPDGAAFGEYASWSGYQVAAFVDLNADRRVDMVMVSDDGKTIYGMIEPREKQQKKTEHLDKRANTPFLVELLAPNLTRPIRSVVAADFNGDSRPDLLLLTGVSTASALDAYISYAGLEGTTRVYGPAAYVATFRAQPLVVDFNSDTISDIFGETVDGKRVILFGGTLLSNESVAYSGPAWSSLGYSAFVDVNGDNFPDVVVLVESAGTYQLQLLIRSVVNPLQVPTGSAAKLVNLPPDLQHAAKPTLGLFRLADFRQDGTVQLLLPVCKTSSCQQSSSLHLYDFGTEEWSNVAVQWMPEGIIGSSESQWSLAATPSPSSHLAVSALVGPSVGDINLDGRVDLLIGLAFWPDGGYSPQPSSIVPAILLNKGFNDEAQVQLKAYMLPGAKLTASRSALRQVAMFDQEEDSTLDVLTVFLDDNDTSTTKLYLQLNPLDAYFLKVMILNGHCSTAGACSDGKLPYGLYVPGVTASYNTEAPDGSRQYARSMLASQSCCGSLQLPFNIFGLGSFANYVEQLTVSIPYTPLVNRTRTFFFSIPKSQIVINPNPLDQPDSWTTKLFLQPLFHMKMYIAITLLCVCVVLIIIISILQWLEVREDRLEKQQETQRFHFDAM